MAAFELFLNNGLLTNTDRSSSDETVIIIQIMHLLAAAVNTKY